MGYEAIGRSEQNLTADDTSQSCSWWSQGNRVKASDLSFLRAELWPILTLISDVSKAESHFTQRFSITRSNKLTILFTGSLNIQGEILLVILIWMTHSECGELLLLIQLGWWVLKQNGTEFNRDTKTCYNSWREALVPDTLKIHRSNVFTCGENSIVSIPI